MNSWLRRKVIGWLGLNEYTQHVWKLNSKVAKAENDLVGVYVRIGLLEAELASLRPKRDSMTGRFTKG
jgi:hypothetical protein